MPPMLDEALLLAIASIAAVIAGFAAVTATLTPPGGSWSQGPQSDWVLQRSRRVVVDRC